VVLSAISNVTRQNRQDERIDHTPMLSQTWKFLPTALLLTILCFVLPFMSVSCNQQKIVTFTGIQMVFGTTLQQPQAFGPPKSQKVNGEPLAMLALLCCIVALGLCFVRNRMAEIVIAALAGVSAIAFVILKARLENQVIQQSHGILQLAAEFGFWLALLLNLATVLLAALAPWRPKH
jgi:FtsH-binding integral membrane protein